MKDLLSIEWLKLKNYRTFWILTGFFVLLLPLWNYGISAGFVNMGGNGGISIISKAYSFSYVWENMGFWASVFVVFISILVIIITTNEYQFRTNRQNVIDGWSRLQFYHAKWGVVVMLSLLTTLYVFIIGVVFAAGFSSMSDFPGHIVKLFYVFVLSLNYYGFGLLLSILFKRSGITIGLFFLYNMIIESFLKFLINWKLEFKAGYLLPLQCSDELLPFPIMDALASMAGMNNGLPSAYYLVASFVWIAVYYFVGRNRLLKTDW